jgi:hypothetical protein
MDGRARSRVFSALIALMAIGSVNWSLFFLPLNDLAALRETITQIPDRAAPEYPRFLEGVRARTPPGATIAIVDPRPYAFYRASYFLTGRTVVPLIGVRDADYIAQWQAPYDLAGFTIVWRGNGGVLAKRTR